ncbi:PocR ligand-binding domain-containing protein [Pseudodesulfovibrio sediminis]|uniref:PocR ligand-binding domain-containing protein n=1 Tax=Pseudodesulfovibrio sediminis TaxID=2810563 RepID=UPI001E3C4EA0|nr:PocR ligand-binding domain-containing protein [Pseudodesulfovibrio sediminis]
MDSKELENRISELRRELSLAEAELESLTGSSAPHKGISFSDLFEVDEIQAIQDAFAKATGVASIITQPDGTPITKPSNFSFLCENIIRKTEKGFSNCMRSDAFLGQFNSRGPTIQPCLSSGLWDGGASISVDGQHIASWLIGQIRNDYLDEERMISYAREIGADETEFLRALKQVTVMPLEQFKQIGQALFLLANLMSWTAYQNLQLESHIQELRTSHEEVSTLRNLLSNIIDSMPSILVGVDTEGRVTHWNMRAADITGFTQEEAQGRLLVDVLPNMADEMNRVTEAITERRPLVQEKVAEDVEGVLRYKDVSVYPLIANGVQGAVLRVDDVTERVRIEEMMIQSEKMLSVGGLAAGMAHEINNPLAAILGSAHLLRKRLLEETKLNKRVAADCGITFDAVAEYADKRDVRAMIESIITSGERAGNVVTNMLGFSRMSDGCCRDENVAEILDNAVELVKSGHDLKQSYNFKDIEFIRDYDDPPPLVNCEASKLQQVFFNVLNNGAQAMTLAHKETERVPGFVLRCKAVDGRVRIEIEDNGPGMEEPVRHRVFEPFFTTKNADVGTGLGMSVSYYIVTEGLGGTMAVESQPGLGATFIIELPQA